MRIDVFPVGIETAAFAELDQRSERLPFVQRVLESPAGRALIISSASIGSIIPRVSDRGLQAISADATRLAGRFLSVLERDPTAPSRLEQMPPTEMR